jgi:hypothetical protein
MPRKSPRISNSEMAGYVNRRAPFRNEKETACAEYWPELASAGVPPRYVVFSYGPHFPMYVYDYQMQEWYGNKDRYSVTTSKHQTQARPTRVRDYFDTEAMRYIAARGFMGWMQHLTASKQAA